MQGIQSNSASYINLVEVDGSLIEQTGSSEVSHSGRSVAVIHPSSLRPEVPPPSYSELFPYSLPSYYEAVGPGVEFSEIPASQPSSIEQEQDIESAESPSSRALAQRRVEASNSCRHCLRIILTAVPPCFVFLLLAIVAIALLIHSWRSTH